jgi:hypothetical protein
LCGHNARLVSQNNPFNFNELNLAAVVPSALALPREAEMEFLLQWAVLAAATLLAASAAIALNWILLQSTFRLMQPAAQPVRVARPELAQATRAVAREFVRG